ncbi:hypothetical protein JT31_21760 [Cedecea neteri]|uniref:Uncharacterized protein n=1 Tax=Cedecea neteri TaxID=158822 RepID=A0A089Q755_9ENTR|nr:hypothetical protein [Cedecea neteri]AIR07141.1 hypothetical protein JT31_21760 [Cedecea neteri]
MSMKIKNDYARTFPDFEVTPKAVVAAIAMSLALRLCEDNFDDAQKLISDEWASLHTAEIVPQKPKRS